MEGFLLFLTLKSHCSVTKTATVLIPFLCTCSSTCSNRFTVLPAPGSLPLSKVYRRPLKGLLYVLCLHHSLRLGHSPCPLEASPALRCSRLDFRLPHFRRSLTSLCKNNACSSKGKLPGDNGKSGRWDASLGRGLMCVSLKDISLPGINVGVRQ